MHPQSRFQRTLERQKELNERREKEEAARKKFEPPPARQFRAKKVPRAVFEPKWEMMQNAEAGRQERINVEAQRLFQLSKPPPQMEESKNASRARKDAEMKRIRAEAQRDLTFRPKVSHALPDFDKLQKRF